MKTIVITLLALMLSGCAAIEKEQQQEAAQKQAQAQREAQTQRNLANYIAATCDRSGFVRGTLQYKECQMKMINMIIPPETTCNGSYGSFNCTTY